MMRWFTIVALVSSALTIDAKLDGNDFDGNFGDFMRKYYKRVYLDKDENEPGQGYNDDGIFSGGEQDWDDDYGVMDGSREVTVDHNNLPENGAYNPQFQPITTNLDYEPSNVANVYALARSHANKHPNKVAAILSKLESVYGGNNYNREKLIPGHIDILLPSKLGQAELLRGHAMHKRVTKRFIKPFIQPLTQFTKRSSGSAVEPHDASPVINHVIANETKDVSQSTKEQNGNKNRMIADLRQIFGGLQHGVHVDSEPGHKSVAQTHVTEQESHALEAKHETKDELKEQERASERASEQASERASERASEQASGRSSVGLKRSIDWSNYFGLDKRARIDNDWLENRYKRQASMYVNKFQQLGNLEDNYIDNAIKYAGAHVDTASPGLDRVRENLLATINKAYQIEKLRAGLGRVYAP